MSLRIITGLAGSGKTAQINREIRDAVLAGQGRRLLIVPEQYSHEAERELCSVCGDTLSQYAEVLSFTGLARSLRAELGGTAKPFLDKGGKLLCMAMAVKECSGKLSMLEKTAYRPEMQSILTSAVDSLKTSCISAENLYEVAEKCGGELGRKLTDLSLIYETYQGILENSYADPSDAMSVLASQIPESSRLGENSVVYVDGFTDFTRAETEVLKAMLKKHIRLTVCVTMDGLENTNEVFAIQRSSVRRLKQIAEELGETFENPPERETEYRRSPAQFLADNLFTYSEEEYDAGTAIELVSAGSPAEECRFAAARILELLREENCRRRDIAVAVRGFDEYLPLLETTFEEFEIPLFTARKDSMSMRPLPLLISCAFDIVNRGWRTDDMISYLGTGLSGISQEDCDLISGYLFRWNLSSRAWHSDRDWEQHPDGIGGKYTEETYLRLQKINEIRKIIAMPLLALEKATEQPGSAAEFTKALYAYLESAKVPETLIRKADRLALAGKKREAEEYRQLWDITVEAINQAYAILADTEIDRETYAGLFVRMLSTYDVGIIPVSLDCITAGDFDRMRRRNIRYLIILGASSDRIPAFSTRNSLFSDEELGRLESLDTPICESPENEMWREYSLLYHCVALPSEKLIVSYPLTNFSGEVTGPSILADRIKKLFGKEPVILAPEYTAESAFLPAMKTAVSEENEKDCAVKKFMEKKYPDEYDRIKKAAEIKRGTLSADSVEILYGKQPEITASKAEKFFSCRYAYFTQYGLKVRPFRQEEFSSSDLGTFTHYVLQHTAEDIKNIGGFSAAEDDFVRETAEKYIRSYEREVLKDFAEKSERFIYLFRRSADNVLKIVEDLARELRASKFEPAAFEFDFRGFDPIPLSGETSGSISLSGIADRIDTWEHGGKTYLRIADYKTGTKKFSMSDLWYGMSMQLVLYLYTLCTHEKKTAEGLQLPDGTSFSPAGVMYVPASRKYITADEETDEVKIQKERGKQRKRSGIVLNADGVPEAWEVNGGTEYTPLEYDKNKEIKGEAAVSEEQIGLLYQHMKKRLCEMAEQLGSGSIDADPYEKGNRSACEYCDMKGLCGFADGENGENVRQITEIASGDVWKLIREETGNA